MVLHLQLGNSSKNASFTATTIKITRKMTEKYKKQIYTSHKIVKTITVTTA